MTELKRTRTRPDDPGLIGKVLGDYRIVSPLSTGGMGVVYRAVHTTLGRDAAIKVLRPELTSNHELVQRFFTEAKAASAIRHPGIVETYHFGYTDDGLAFLVMELLVGESLAHRIVARKRLPELVAASIARGIASALTAAHSKGIIHRDLKPDNVFLVADPDVMFGERPKILDFGIAKLNDPSEANVRHTRTGALIGTPLYMAPEQARAAGEIDHRADLYSLGCILYELLVGAPPFVAEGAGEIIAMQMFAEPEPPSVRIPSLSPELERITMRLLHKEPSERFQSAEATAEALSSVLGRLSGELSAAVPGQGAGLPAALFTPVPASMPSSVLSTRLPVIDTTTMVEERRSSAMPVIAGLITVLIAGAALFFVWKKSSTPAAAPAADARTAPIAVAVDAAVELPPPAPDAAAPTPVVHAGSDEPHAHPPVHPPVVHHPVTPTSSPGPTTTIHDTGPVTSPDHTANGSPIFPTLDETPKPAPAPTPAPAPEAPKDPP